MVLREAAYAQGLEEYEELVRLPTFRDFVGLYIAEGHKRSRNKVSICNSDPEIVAMASRWMRRVADKDPTARVQYHADQDAMRLRAFWSEALEIPPDMVRLYVKSNSGQLRSRVWRCAYGVAALDLHDTYFRARVAAWMDRIKASWG